MSGETLRGMLNDNLIEEDVFEYILTAMVGFIDGFIGPVKPLDEPCCLQSPGLLVLTPTCSVFLGLAKTAMDICFQLRCQGSRASASGLCPEISRRELSHLAVIKPLAAG